ncbi:hypothetical protein ON021_08575, partial [Microcoleus sp. HI-ES]|nr:hypothetical protein [Microcoleus sp. HI-ES]
VWFLATSETLGVSKIWAGFVPSNFTYKIEFHLLFYPKVPDSCDRRSTYFNIRLYHLASCG